MRKQCIILSLLLTLPTSSRGQAAAAALAIGGLDKLLDRIESVSLYGGNRLGSPPGDTIGPAGQVPWVHEYGLEFGIHLGNSGNRMDFLPWTRDRKYKEQKREEVLKKARKAQDRKNGIPPAAPESIYVTLATGGVARIEKPKATDQDYKVAKLTVKRRPGFADDSTFELSPKDKDGPLPLFEYDLGIGYGQMDGITVHSPYEIHGNVRELPSVSAYVTLHLGANADVYFGARTGLISLQDTQLYTTRTGKDAAGATTTIPGDSAISITASSFEYGIPLGIEASLGNVRAFVEFDFMHREFNSLNYGAGLPPGARHTFDFSGHSILLGLQFPIPKPAKD